MERELEIRQPPNPVETASCISRLLFSWVTPLFREGYRRTLQVEDLYACPKWERSERKADRLQAEWDEEIRKMKQGKQPDLLRAIFRAFGFTYIMISLLVLVEECFKNVMQPMMLGWVVRYFAAPESISKTEFYLSAAGVSILGGMHIFTHHPYFFNMQRMGMRIRIACCSLVYRKALRLSQAALSKTAVGQMVNLLSNDVNRFDQEPWSSLLYGYKECHNPQKRTSRHSQQSVLFVPYLVAGPLQTAVITWVLWQHLGISCIAGISFILLYIPFQGCLGKAFSRLRAKTAALTDERIRLVNEFVAGMRVIKMYTWETPFALLVNNMRRREVRMIQRTSVLRAVNMGLFFMSSKLVLFLCFVTFALLGNTLTSECVFVSMSLFNSLRLAMTLYFPFGVGQGAETLISVKRLQKFLLLEEQEQTGALNGSKLRPKIHNCRVELQNVTASWTKESSEPTLRNITATVKPGELLVVIGPVGCGKTSLLMAILGELRLSAGSAKALGRIAYASQEPWMFTGSLRNNVVFDSTYDRERYRKVIHAAAMERDLYLLPYGDKTLVSDKGVSLSGGQKARVNLARALYYDADIYLLDDPLSAVDTAVAKHLFEVCIRGYLKNKIVILCTHQLQFLKSANHILVLKEGKMLALGSYWQLQRAGIDFVSLLEENLTVPDSRRSSFDELAEETCAPVGSETLDAASPGAFFESNLSLAGSYDDSHSDIYQSMSDIKGSEVPVEAEETRSTGSVKSHVYWSYMRAGAGPLLMPLLFVSSILAQAIFNGSDFWLTYWTGQSEAAAKAALLNGTEMTAVGVIATVLNKTQGTTSTWTQWWSSLDTVTYNVLVYAIIIGGLLLSSMARTVAFFVMCMRASVNLHNRMFSCIIRAPIRFFDTNPIGRIQNRFSKDLGTIDDLLPPTGLDITFIFLNLVGVLVVVAVISPWIIIPTLLLFVLFFYLRRFYMRTARDVKRLEGVSSVSGGGVGLAIANALMLTGMFQWGVRQSAEIESQIGVVGRTGAGKSSIIAALFRMTEPDGAILIDGIDIRFIGLHDLRRKISIIPQDPVLFTGPIRRNLDPFSEHSDAELWKALEEVRLKASIEDLPGGLSTEVCEGGGNFSVGQRQLICLARAVLRQNKILVMDEATANVDPRTDALIQRTIRENFASCTVFTIAHRLHTIMDSDRVIVLDAGRIVEFDEPYKLMKSECSQFTSMVQNTGPSMARQLWNMAREAYAQRWSHSHHEVTRHDMEYIEEIPPWFVPSRPDVVMSDRAAEVIQEEDGEEGQCCTSL
ncbi:ATP-binding cassette sub-family C member 4 isoform X6 [Rhipicephalus microplus]|uniref:ATP-binding cassette sub-family C member 4 isoform X6 n=1 Tax=Rhipicephalus microplus TaxID=6941 RepID=UPI003F6AD3A7